MAIQKLRDGSEGIIAKIIVGLIVFAFAMFGFGSITTFLAPVPKVAEVGSIDITQQEMEMQLERSRRILQSRNQTVDDDELRKNVLDSLIERALLVSTAESLDMHYSDAAMDQSVIETEAFQVNGRFDPEQFKRVLSGMGFTPLSYREEVRKDQQVNHLARGIAQTAFTTRKEARKANSLGDQVRDIAYLRISADELKDLVTVEAQEVKAVYDANPDDYMSEAIVTIEYVEVKNADLVAEVQLDAEDIKNAYEADLERYTTPERRRFSHILIEINDEVTEEVAQATMESVVQRIQAGEEFGAVAKELSQDPGSAEEGGDLGFQPKGTFVEAFEEAGFALEPNQISAPVKTVFGFHLIKLLAIEAAAIPSFDEVQASVEQDLRVGKAGDIFVEKSDILGTRAFENVSLADLALELGLELKTDADVGSSEATGVMSLPGVAEAAFSDQVLQDGLNSDLLAVSPTHNLVLRVVGHTPSTLRDLADVEADIRQTLVDEKVSDLARERADELVAMLESGSLTRFVADKYGLTWVRSEQTPRQKFDLDRELLAEAFRLPRPADGQKSVSAISLANGDAAVVSVTKVENAGPDTVANAQLRAIARALAQRRGGNDYTEFRKDLQASVDIERL